MPRLPKPTRDYSHYAPFGTHPDDQVKPNSGVMYQGMDMTMPVANELSDFKGAAVTPPRKPSAGSVLSGLRGKKAPAKPRQIVGLNGEPYTPKTKAGGPVGLD